MFQDILFPKTIAEGAKGGRGWSTDVVRNRGGWRKANQNWATPLGKWEVAQVNRTFLETRELQGFFHGVAEGRLHSFRFHDAKDCTMRRVSALRLTSTTFQMRQLYKYLGQITLLPVTKPVPNDLSLIINLGTTETTDYTVDTTTGIITFGSAIPTNLIPRVSGQYHIPVCFDMDDFSPEQVDVNYWTWPQIKLIEERFL